MNEDDVYASQRFRRKIVLNIALGILGLLGLTLTFAFLWGSPGFFIEAVEGDKADHSGVGTGLLCILYFAYQMSITGIVWNHVD